MKKPARAKDLKTTDSLLSFLLRRQRWAIGITLAGIMFLGFLVRVEDLREWRKKPHLAFYKGEPILINFDGYYYLKLARDFAQGRKDKSVKLSRIPLLSLTAGAVAKAGNLSLNWVGVLLPAFLGVLLAIPLYGFGRIYGGIIGGLASIPVALFSPYYVYRSSIGWFDTDCMYVTLTLGISFCALKFALERGGRRYLYLVLTLILYFLLVRWWGKRGYAIVATAVPLLPAFSLFYRPGRKEALLFVSIVAGLVVGFLLWKGTAPIAKHLNWAYHGFYAKVHSYFSKEGPGFFPSQLISISETQTLGFREFISMTTNSAPVLIISSVGLAALAWRRTKEALFLAIPFSVGIIGGFVAKKFVLFLIPLIGLGVGYVVAWMWGLRQRHRVMGYVAVFVAVLAAAPAIYKDIRKTRWSKVSPALISAMAEISKVTPKNALIWAWWDLGYHIEYWAERRAITTPGRHGPQAIVYNALPLSSNNPRFAANFMRFVATRGLWGMRRFYAALGNDYPKAFNLMKEILASGPEEALALIRKANLRPIGKWKRPQDWLRFFYPPRPRPVYLFLDYSLIKTAYWWYFFGTWDPAEQRGSHPRVHFLLNPLIMQGDHLVSRGRFDLDMKEGIAITRKGNYPISKVFINDGTRLSIARFRKRGYVVDFFQKNKMGVVSSQDISSSLFAGMFYRSFADKRYFSPVFLELGVCQLWKVMGDKIE